MEVNAADRKRVDDAVETLAHYNKSPFITDFLKQQAPPRISPTKYDKDELCAVIRQVLLGEYAGKRKYALSLESLLEYLDHLQETGRQHVYFFHLPEDHRDAMLERLRDTQEVKAMFGGQEDVYADGRVIWEAKSGPELARIRYLLSSEGLPERLVAKWVESREYWAPQKSTPNATSSAEEDQQDLEDAEDFMGVQSVSGSTERQRVQVRVPHDERAVSFLVVDLKTGACELRIQALHGNARAARQEQQRSYGALVSNILGAELSGPMVLAPAIRRALITRDVPILRCSAILPDGGKFIGGKDELPPVDVRKLEAGVTIRFDWSQTSGGVGRVELDGRLDEVVILRPLLPENHHSLIQKVRQWRQEELGTAIAQIPTPSESSRSEPSAVPEDASSAAAQKDAWASLIAALTRALPEPAAIEPRIDRAIREYARTHEVDNSNASSAVAEQSTEVPRSTLPPDERSLGQFLGYIKEVAQSEKLNYQREIKPVRAEEQWMFRLSVIAAVLALLVVATGAVLIFASQTAIGTITSILGAVTGGGTILIRSYAKNLKAKRESIQDQQRDSQQTLLAIQTALAISEPAERARAMSGLTASLLGRIGQ